MHFIFPEQDTAKLAQYRKTNTINSLDLIWQTDGLTILGCETNMREREVSLSFAMLYLNLSKKNAVLLHWTSKWPTVGCYHPIWKKTGTSNLYVFTNLFCFFFLKGGRGVYLGCLRFFAVLKVPFGCQISSAMLIGTIYTCISAYKKLKLILNRSMLLYSQPIDLSSWSMQNFVTWGQQMWL